MRSVMRDSFTERRDVYRKHIIMILETKDLSIA